MMDDYNKIVEIWCCYNVITRGYGGLKAMQVYRKVNELTGNIPFHEWQLAKMKVSRMTDEQQEELAKKSEFYGVLKTCTVEL